MRLDDPLADPLRELAEKAHAVLYAGYDLRVVDRQLAEHPARRRFDGALDDDELSALFPAGDAGYVFLSTGEGGHISRELLAPLLVAGAGNQLRALQETFSADELADEAELLLDRVKRLVRGEEVEFPAVSLFGGVGIAPGVNVELPWGVLAYPTQWANTWAEWSRADLMLVCDVPVRVAVVEPGENPWPPPEMAELSEQAHDRLDRLEHRTALTLLLGMTGKSAVVRLWRSVLGPLFGQGFSTRGGNPGPLFGTQAHIDAAAAKSLSAWGELLEARHEPRLDIAVDRLISSVTTRHDPGDALIDAVIALEAVFAGTDQGELSFRISAALASLLEPSDPEARGSVFREARAMYAARSKIVHGQAPPTPEAGAVRDRAFELGTRALATLYEHHPDLLGDDARSRSLILRLNERSPASAGT
jgi:hypothetical protein